MLAPPRSPFRHKNCYPIALSKRHFKTIPAWLDNKKAVSPGEREIGKRPHDERISPSQAIHDHFSVPPSGQRIASRPVIPSNSPHQTSSTFLPAPSADEAIFSPLDEGPPGGFQDAHIRAILRVMSLGHLFLRSE